MRTAHGSAARRGAPTALKAARRRADNLVVRFERLVIEADTNTITLDLHPRLTVVAGLGRLEREALAGELLGALASKRTGVHVEAVEDSGRRLAVFRPDGAAGRVVDVDHARDVTGEFLDEHRRLNLLQGTGLDLTTARRKLRFGAGDLQAASQGTQLLRRLADVDQARLWAAAEAVLAFDAALQAEAEALGSAPEDAEIVERIEQRHRRFEHALGRHEHTRRRTLAISGTATASAVLAGAVGLEAGSIGFLFVAILAMLASVVTRNRLAAARSAEAEALEAAGAQSYLGFHLQRVNGMLSSEAARKRLLEAAADHRRAAEAWRALAGDVPVEWAMEHHEEIAAAARVRVDLSSHAHVAADVDTAGDVEDTTELARVLVARLAELRRLGGGQESFPLVLEDPFAELDRAAKPALLELLSHTSGSPQLVYLTDDEDVASWARLEALTGTLAIVEPKAAPSGVDRTGRQPLIEI